MTTQSARQWVRTDPTSIRDDITRLGGIEAAAEYNCSLAAERAADGDTRWGGITEEAMAAAIAELDSESDPQEETPSHSKDEDCTLDETDCCTVCGSYHADPCPDCGGRGFHKDDCPCMIEPDEAPTWKIWWTGAGPDPGSMDCGTYDSYEAAEAALPSVIAECEAQAGSGGFDTEQWLASLRAGKYTIEQVA